MSQRRNVILGTLGWVAVISLLHGFLNLRWLDAPTRWSANAVPFRVGFLPVT